MFVHGEPGRKSTTIHVLMVDCMCGHGWAMGVGVGDKCAKYEVKDHSGCTLKVFWAKVSTFATVI